MHCSASRRNAIPAQNAAIAAEDFHSPEILCIGLLVLYIATVAFNREKEFRYTCVQLQMVNKLFNRTVVNLNYEL